MNIDKIGKFIQERRKLKRLTQEALAEKLNISNRAISKWERGLCLPDASIMIPLCEILDINVNELLSGKMLDKKEYNEKSEELLLELKNQEEEKSKIIFHLAYAFMLIVVTLVVIICIISNLFISNEFLKGVIIVLSVMVAVISCLYTIRIESTIGYQECNECHHKYKLSYNQALWSMHIGSTRYLRCPKCNKKSWHKKVISK